MQHIGSQITAGNRTFDVVNELVFLDFAVTSKNDVCLEINPRIKNAKSCNCSHTQNSHVRINCCYKGRLYSPCVQIWDTAAQGIFQKTLLCKIFGPACVGGNFHIRTNKELSDLLNDIDVDQSINIHPAIALARSSRQDGKGRAKWWTLIYRSVSLISQACAFVKGLLFSIMP